uniref:4-alpha-glucanotransferase n=1 Tax=Fagus sylvatica TaxID=28930 RepID=A0A2N9EXN8_FAGSY
MFPLLLQLPLFIVPPVPPISQVYVRRRNQDVPLVPPLPPVEFSLPLPPSASSSADSPPPQSTSDLDLPIAIRKGKRTCTEHPISNCVSFDHLSPSFKAFSLSLSSLVVPKSYREALSHPGWRKAMEEENALELNHTWDLIPKPRFIVGCRWVFINRIPMGECVCHLKKSIYGLKQSPRAWFDKFSKAVVSHVVYVDDIVITGSDKEGIQILINHLSSSFLTKDLGKLRYFLGIEVARSKASISLSQRKYTLDILQDTGYLGSKPVATPMEPNLKLMPDEGDFVDDPDTYRRLVGKLIYLTITRPDISYAVSIVSQFMTNPRVPHMNAVIRILKYLKNAPGRGLFYRSSGHLRIEGYTDADWAGSPSDRKSTTGYCTFIGGNLVTWRSKKQSVVARSSAEAEYRAMAHTTCELTWLRTVLQEFGLLTQGPTPLYCDNQAAIHIASNPVFHERTKHIEVDCHFVRSKVESKDIITPFVPSGSQLADIFTKALPKNAIDSICSKLGDANCGNTLLISLEELVKDGLLMKEELPKPVDADRVNYSAVADLKDPLITKAAERLILSEGELKSQLEAFRRDPNISGWLEDAAYFAAIDDSLNTFSWYDWPEPIKNRHLAALEEIYQSKKDFIDKFIAQQFLFQRQWRKVRKYAQMKGISIMGDMPIYVGYHSADVWANRKHFSLNRNGFPLLVSGVPPDAFSETGQLWGSPLYDWKAMEKDGFSWWICRIRRAQDLYDEFRIDHFRGFAGFWAVSSEAKVAMVGRWKVGPGKSIFDAFSRAVGKINLIAEDL